TVHHRRLLHELERKGLPRWLIRWVRSFLTSRSTVLSFDGADSAPFQQECGIPQGSPISPILFILYTSTLYEELRVAGVTAVGYADDTTILAFGRDTRETNRGLEAAHRICLAWAPRVGMQFDHRSTIRFTCRRNGGRPLRPSPRGRKSTPPNSR